MSYELRVMSYELRVKSYELRVKKSRITGHWSLVTIDMF